MLRSTKDATKFYEAKVEELGTNLKDLEAIIQGKSNNLRAVEDGTLNLCLAIRDFYLSIISVLRQKVLSSGAAAAS
ncbi:hypothetical protein DH86_00003359 [Scytalidium sp. 3C]|nr:hypothetical protein DH86_00003359 [Scytalidium sp. 3C]